MSRIRAMSVPERARNCRRSDNYQASAYPNRNCDGSAAWAARVAVIVRFRGSTSDSRFVLSAQQQRNLL